MSFVILTAVLMNSIIWQSLVWKDIKQFSPPRWLLEVLIYTSLEWVIVKDEVSLQLYDYSSAELGRMCDYERGFVLNA